MFSQLVDPDDEWQIGKLQQLDADSRDLTPQEPCGVCLALDSSGVLDLRKQSLPGQRGNGSGRHVADKVSTRHSS